MLVRTVFKRSIWIALTLAAGALYAQGSNQSTQEYNLSQALFLIVKTFHVSVLGELIDPIPLAVNVGSLGAGNLEATLNRITAQCPNYTWYRKQGVIIFSEKNLLRAPANPFNQTLQQYSIPDNLSEFKLTFPSAVEASQIKEGVGAIGSGIALPADLSPALTRESLSGQTARDILVRVAKEVGNLYSVLILPNARFSRKDIQGKEFLTWELAGGKGLPEYKPHAFRWPKELIPK